MWTYAGYSTLFSPRPQHWPATVHVCGFWTRARCAGIPPEPALSSDVEQALGSLSAGAANAPICIDFGAIVHMGLMPDAHNTLQVVAGALVAAGKRGLMLTGGCAQLHAAHAQLAVEQQAALLLHAQPVSHPALLPRCGLLIHHGGSGTTAAGGMRRQLCQDTASFTHLRHLCLLA